MDIGNWGPLHEVGHGYDTVNFGSAEIWNNVLAHYYQVSAFGAAAGWGCLMLTVPDTTRNAIASDISIPTNMIVKLYSWVNILDKLGPQKALYRYNNAQ